MVYIQPGLDGLRPPAFFYFHLVPLDLIAHCPLEAFVLLIAKLSARRQALISTAEYRFVHISFLRPGSQLVSRSIDIVSTSAC